MEFRCPDASGNPYLSFAAMMMAAYGIKKIESFPNPEGPRRVAARRGWWTSRRLPPELSAVIDRLEDDHEYLTEGSVFTLDLIETWIN